MSTININVAVNTGNANSRLKDLHTNVASVGKGAKSTAANMTEFNRALFGATAFIGVFTQAFSAISQGMMAGSEFDRAVGQFSTRFGKDLPQSLETFANGAQGVIGPGGQFMKMIRGMTDNSVDMVSAMTSALKLQSSGAVTDVKQIAEVMAMASTAAKNAGKDSAEGISRITKFLQDGSLAHLEHLGLLRKNNAGMKLHFALLEKAGGVAGTALTGLQRLSIGLQALREHTMGSMKGQRDLRDTLQDVAQFSSMLKNSFFALVGSAMQPMMEAFIDMSAMLIGVIEDIKQNKKEILFLAKAFAFAGSAVSAFIITMTALKLIVITLKSTLLGIPFLTVALMAMAAAVAYNKFTLKGFVEGLQLLGAVFKGTFQLVKSFLTDSENFAAGMGYMDESTHNLLKSNGLLGFVENLSRVISIISLFAKGAVDGFTSGFNAMMEVLGPFGKKIKDFLGLSSGPWSRDWLTAATAIGQALGKVTVVVLALVAAMKALAAVKMVSSFGGLLGSAGAAAAGGVAKKSLLSRAASGLGNSSRFASAVGGAAIAAPSTVKRGIFGTVAKGKSGMSAAKMAGLEILTNPKGKMAGVREVIGNAAMNRAAGTTGFGSKLASGVANAATHPKGMAVGGISSMWTSLVAGFKSLMPVLGGAVRLFAGLAILVSVIAVLTGFVEGLWKAREGISKFIGAVTNWVSDLFNSNSILKTVKDVLFSIVGVFTNILGYLRALGDKFGSWVGKVAGEAGESIDAKNLQARRTKAGELLRDNKITLPAGLGTKDEKGTMILPDQTKLDPAQQIATAQLAIRQAAGDKQESMRAALKSALDQNKEEGINISPEEWVTIFAAGVDGSKTMATVAENTAATAENGSPKTNIGSRKGVC